MVGMTLQNRKRSVELLKKHNTRQFVRQSHFSERDHCARRGPCFCRKSIRCTHRKHYRRSAINLLLEKCGQLFRGHLAASGIEQDQRVPLLAMAFPGGKLEQRRLVSQLQPFRFSVTREPLQILGGERLDRRFFRLPDPGNFQLHIGNLSTNLPDFQGPHYFFLRAAGFREGLAPAFFGAAFLAASFPALFLETGFLAAAFLAATGPFFKSEGSSRFAVFQSRSKS